ncbi:MAG: hypothetical protein JST63_15995, partial [Bacteroidetes bacterium]|nr:hypothetical protein [Bacteroidota bacterium]
LYLLLSLACAVLRYASHNTIKFFDKEKKQKKKESPCVGGVAKKPKGNGISPEG